MLAWFYQGFIDDWLNEEVVRWRVRGLPVRIRTSRTDFASMARGFAADSIGSAACQNSSATL